ncbi:LysE family transporter [Cellulomonas sp. URHB0016]
MPATTTALVLGALAGLAVAMPVGPVGILLLRTGLLEGTRVAVAAAVGIATVDAAYAVLAVVAGEPVSHLATTHAHVARLVSSAVLLVVGVVALRQWWGDRPHGPGEPTHGAPTEAAGPRGPASVRGAYGRFVGLTAVNPLTAVTFATVAVGLATQVGERAGEQPGAAGAVAFVLGAAAASLVWQLALAVVGGGLGGRLGPVGRSRASLVGALVVVALAVALAMG